jgi:hypothetical protein
MCIHEQARSLGLTVRHVRSQAIDKQADAMGNLCRLCGVVYPEG